MLRFLGVVLLTISFSLNHVVLAQSCDPTCSRCGLWEVLAYVVSGLNLAAAHKVARFLTVTYSEITVAITNGHLAKSAPVGFSITGSVTLEVVLTADWRSAYDT